MQQLTNIYFNSFVRMKNTTPNIVPTQSQSSQAPTPAYATDPPQAPPRAHAPDLAPAFAHDPTPTLASSKPSKLQIRAAAKSSSRGQSSQSSGGYGL